MPSSYAKEKEKKGGGDTIFFYWQNLQIYVEWGDVCGMWLVFVFRYQIWRTCLSKGKSHEKCGMEFCKHKKKLWYFVFLKTDVWKGVNEKIGEFEVEQIECEGALICILWLCLKMLIKDLQTSDFWG